MATAIRGTVAFPLFDRVCDLSDKQLPTHEDIIKCILYRKSKMKNNSGGKDPSIRDICRDVACDVIKIYNKASIHPLSDIRILRLLQNYYDEYKKLTKCYNNRVKVQSYIDKLSVFLDHSKKLFDFSHCKCDSFDSCTCDKDKKIPIIERSFLLDQRSDRKLYIGSQDLKESGKLQKREARKRRHEELSLPSTSRSENRIELIVSDENDTLTYESSSTNTDDEFLPAKTSMKRICLDTESKTDVSGEEKKLQKGLVVAKAKSLPFFAEACDRVGVSDRGAALLSNLLLDDFELVQKNCPDDIIINRYVLFLLY